MVCRTCGGTGRTPSSPDVCPKCGKKRTTLSNLTTIAADEKPNINYRELIPNSYKGRVYSNKKLYGMYPSNKNFKNYCDNLQALLNKVIVGKLPNVSAILYAPTGHGKHTWAYSMLQEAINNNLSTLPLLDFKDISNIVEGKLDDKALEYYRGITEYDVYTADLAIVNINSYTLKYSNIMMYLLDKRSSANKATFFISTVPMGTLIRFNRDIKTLITDKAQTERHMFYISYGCEERSL